MTNESICAPLLPSTGCRDYLVFFVHNKLYLGLQGIILPL